MDNYNRSGGRSWGRGGNWWFGWGGRGWRDDRGWRRERPEMFRTTCDECGSNCEVPFRPTWDKPVFCSDCFETMWNSSRWWRDDRGWFMRDRRDDRWRRGNDFSEKRMYTVTCAECWEDCEVPFRPTWEKPVYCNDCFWKNDNKKSWVDYKADFEALNAKLDMIIKHFWITEIKKEKIKIKLVEEVEGDDLIDKEEGDKKSKDKEEIKEKPTKKIVVKKSK